MDKPTEIRIDELVFKSIEGLISEQECRELEAMIESSSAARDYYSSCIDFNLGMLKIKDVVHHSLQMKMALEEMAEHEKTAPTIQVEKPAAPTIIPVFTKTITTERKISRLAIYALSLAVAAIVPLMIMVLLTPVRPVVGVLTDSIDAEWVTDDEIPVKGEIVRQGELTLVKGFAEITFNNGAVVVVEAPAMFELESPKSMFVASGKISAVVSEVAMGFTVNTLSASIVDLGTRFGVSVGGDGSCSLHMFEGKANLFAGRKDQKKTSRIVNVDEARSVDYKTGNIQEIEIDSKGYARFIDSETGSVWHGQPIDLADIAGGGNGLKTGTIGKSIRPDSGKISTSPAFAKRSGTFQYTLVDDSVFIDGVFVPDSEDGQLTISSQNHSFQNCPDTSNLYYTDIVNGGKIMDMNRVPTPTFSPLTLGRNIYGTDANPALIMHANLGITFDLAAIRQIIPQANIVSFQSACGISEVTPVAQGGTVDFFVLVDGQLKFQKMGVNKSDGSIEINFDLNSEDRFLTLITTDGGNGYGDDYSFFAEPILVLE